MARPKFIPHPGKQTEFLSSTADRVFFGGARGGSKSFALAWKAAFMVRKSRYTYNDDTITRKEYDLLVAAGKQPKFIVEKMSIHYPHYIGIIVRRTYPMLERNLKPECDKLYVNKKYGGVWHEKHHFYLFPSGAKIYLVHCKDKTALKNYIGGNYNFIGVDEANQFPEDWIDKLESSLRTDDIEINPQLCLASNPGDTGHVWLKKKYVDKCVPIQNGKKIWSEEFKVFYQPFKTAKPYFDEEGISHQYIPATVFDNPSILLNDKKYVRKLKQLGPTLRAMWLEGRWDVYQGQFFGMWDPNVHIIRKEDFVWGSKAFNQYTHSLYRFYDYGTKAPFVCLFAAVDADENMIIFDEIVEVGYSPTRQAKHVNNYSMKKYGLAPDDFQKDVADPSYRTKQGEKEGVLYSPMMHYADEGIYLTLGNNDRKAGAKVVYNALDLPRDEEGKWITDATPRVRFTDNCQYCLDFIPTLPEKENDPEDVDTDAEDHAYDALRYGCVSMSWGGGKQKKKKMGWRDVLAREARGGTGNVEGSTYMGC